MKINSNTIKLEKETYSQLEKIIKKIASENKINNIKSVEVKLSKENGLITFKKAYWFPGDFSEFKEGDIIKANVPMGMAGVVKEVHEDGSIVIDTYLSEKGAIERMPDLIDRTDILLTPEEVKENRISKISD